MATRSHRKPPANPQRKPADAATLLQAVRLIIERAGLTAGVGLPAEVTDALLTLDAEAVKGAGE